MQNKKIITEIIVILLVLLFLYTGLSKFLDFKGFTHDLNNQPFPNALTPVLRWLIPFVEIAIVMALIFEKTRMIGLYASLVLMSLFTVYTALVLFHVFEYVPCSCGGVIKHLTWPQHLLFNLFFLIITSMAIRLQSIDKTQINYNIQ
jgi:putative oxidoreductase